MPIITSDITFTVGDAAPTESTSVDLLPLSPSVPGELPGDPAGVVGGTLRRLVYPGSTLAPLVYADNPDVYVNFCTAPLDKRPRLLVVPTLQGNPLVGWLGVSRDMPVEERWLGSETTSRMTLAFFLDLQAYYENPPTDGTYIIWEPRDRTTKRYNILIESLALGGGGGQGGQENYEFNYIAARHGYVTGVVTFRFRIVSEVA